MNSVECSGVGSRGTGFDTAISLLIFTIFLSSSPLFVLHLLPYYNHVIVGALALLLVPIIYTGRFRLIRSKLIIPYYLFYIWIIAFNLYLGRSYKVILVYGLHLIILLIISYYIFTFNRVRRILKKMFIWCFFLFACGQILIVLFLIAEIVEPSIIRLEAYFGQTRLWVPFLGFTSASKFSVFGINFPSTSSFYLEPSAYAGALIFPIIWALLSCKKKKKKIVPCLCFVTVLTGAVISGSVTAYIAIIAVSFASMLNRKRNRLKLTTTVLVVGSFVTFSIVGIMFRTSEGTLLQMTDLVGQGSSSESGVLNKRSSFFVRATELKKNINTIVEKPWGVGLSSTLESEGNEEGTTDSTSNTSNLVTAYLISGPLGLFVLLFLYSRVFKSVINLKGLTSAERSYALTGIVFLLVNSFVSSYTFYTVGTIIFLSIFIKDIEILSKKQVLIS